MSQTTGTYEAGDLLIGVATYEKNGEIKTKSIRLGKLLVTNGRIWGTVDPHYLSTLVALDARAVLRAQKQKVDTHLPASLLTRAGRPLTLDNIGSPAAPKERSGTAANDSGAQAMDTDDSFEDCPY